MGVARKMSCWPGSATAPTPAMTDQTWLDWLVLDFNYQVEVFNARAATAAVRGEWGAPPIETDNTMPPTRPDRLPTDEISSMQVAGTTRRVARGQRAGRWRERQ